MLRNIVDEVDNRLNGHELTFEDETGGEGKTHRLVFWLGGDLKFLKLMLGQMVCIAGVGVYGTDVTSDDLMRDAVMLPFLQSCGSAHPCLYCTIHKERFRHDGARAPRSDGTDVSVTHELLKGVSVSRLSRCELKSL